MGIRVAVVTAVLCTSTILLPVFGQQPVSSVTTDPQAVALLTRSSAVLQGLVPTNDLTLSGQARQTAGSDDETGTTTLNASATGGSRIELDLPSGQRVEIRTLSAGFATGSWSGKDEVKHPIPQHNLLVEPAWFAPAIAFGRILSTPSYNCLYVGEEKRDSGAVQHIVVSQQSADPQQISLIQHLSVMDLYLDSTTLLPVSIAYKIHPDNDPNVDIATEIQFSDYRSTGGGQFPFHVQRYLNGSLTLDLQFQTVALNTGLSATTFSTK